jgi:hypothetical protein
VDTIRNRQEDPRKQQSASAGVAGWHPVLAHGFDDGWDIGVGVAQEFFCLWVAKAPAFQARQAISAKSRSVARLQACLGLNRARQKYGGRRLGGPSRKGAAAGFASARPVPSSTMTVTGMHHSSIRSSGSVNAEHVRRVRPGLRPHKPALEFARLRRFPPPSHPSPTPIRDPCTNSEASNKSHHKANNSDGNQYRSVVGA